MLVKLHASDPHSSYGIDYINNYFFVGLSNRANRHCFWIGIVFIEMVFLKVEKFGYADGLHMNFLKCLWNFSSSNSVVMIYSSSAKSISSVTPLIPFK